MLPVDYLVRLAPMERSDRMAELAKFTDDELIDVVNALRLVIRDFALEVIVRDAAQRVRNLSEPESA